MSEERRCRVLESNAPRALWHATSKIQRPPVEFIHRCGIAQLVERGPVKALRGGSSPPAGAAAQTTRERNLRPAPPSALVTDGPCLEDFKAGDLHRSA